jgi:NAD(P)-dependent dehydrogenase (short-subunit alcohol dehydrogenase family)
MVVSRTGGAVLATGAVAAGLVALAVRSRRPRYGFAGQSVLITGGSRGLGLLLARELADEGARLALVARDEGELERAAAELRARGAAVLPLACDVRSRAEVEGAVKRVVERYGTVNVLVNNAGEISVGPLAHMELADFESSVAVHLWGPVYATLAVLPHMRRTGSGRIVNIASIGGRVAVPHLLPYSTGKFALVGFSDGLRQELAAEGIRVTTVSPGLMRTGSHVRARFAGRREDEFAWFATMAALPVTSIDGRRAARQIVEAARRGDAELVITTQARAAIVARALFPRLTAGVLAAVARLLPGPIPGGDVKKEGWESRAPGRPPRLVTRLADRASERNNELGPPAAELPERAAGAEPSLLPGSA